MWVGAALVQQFTDTKCVHGTGSVKYEKLATKYPWIYGYFLTVYRCRLATEGVSDWD